MCRILSIYCAFVLSKRRFILKFLSQFLRIIYYLILCPKKNMSVKEDKTGPEVKNFFHAQQLNMKFKQLINTKIYKNKGIPGVTL